MTETNDWAMTTDPYWKLPDELRGDTLHPAHSCCGCEGAAEIVVERIETAYEYYAEAFDYKNHPIGEDVIYDQDYYCRGCYVDDTHYLAGKRDIWSESD